MIRSAPPNAAWVIRRPRGGCVLVVGALLCLAACGRTEERASAVDGAESGAAQDTTPPGTEPPVPAAVVELNRAARMIVDSIRSAEARRLLQANGLASRVSIDRLRVAPTAAEPIAYDDILTGGDIMRLHVFRGRLPQGYLLVEVIQMEGGHFLLIDERTGAELDIDGMPVVSPDGARFATTSFDLVAGHVPNRLVIHRFTEDGVEREWSHEPRDWGPTDAQWIDGMTLRFQRNTIDLETQPHAVTQAPATARHGTAGWQIGR